MKKYLDKIDKIKYAQPHLPAKNQHLRGNKTYGIYPLLDGNVSYFIAADFDSKNWQKDAIKFYQQCQKYNLSAYIECSRSGNGGHVWLFFENQYSANKSRNIAINILQESKTKIIIKNTDIEVPFKVKVDDFQVLSKIIVFDSNRNSQIIDDIRAEIDKGSKCLVLTERKDHVEVLSYYLKGKYETIILTGDLTDKQKKTKIKQIEAGHFQVLLATGQLIGEGADFQNLGCLFLIYRNFNINAQEGHSVSSGTPSVQCAKLNLSSFLFPS